MVLNDLSSPAALLATRRSGKPRDLVGPGPDDAQLQRILNAAIRVPDHGKIGPWRFVIVKENQRRALADLITAAYRAEEPDGNPKELEKLEQFAHQAPVLVVVLSSPKPDSLIPLWEQQLSAGAACMNMITAATAEGFAAGWLTAWPSYSPTVLRAFGTGGERIAGFIFIGTPARALEERPRAAYDAVVSKWSLR